MIEVIVEQHVEDAVLLAALRRRQLNAPHVNLQHLARIDERLAAHLDGLAIAGEAGWRYCEMALGSVSASALFAAAVTTIHLRNGERLDRLFAIAEAMPETRAGLVSAFGWVSGEQLRDLAAGLLASTHPFRTYVGLAACAMHRVDPGTALMRALESSDAPLRARALRTVGELGRRDLARACETSVTDIDADCRFWAAWSAVRLGSRAEPLERLAALSVSSGSHARRALDLALLAMEPQRGHALLLELAKDAKRAPDLLWGCGLLGDTNQVPWLIERMKDPRYARAAGEALAMITGVDLAEQDLDAEPPEPTTPNDDPNDDNVRMDPDEDLPWPDATRIASWWHAKGGSYPVGHRLFLGRPVTPDVCVDVLRKGFQRQRRLAALQAALLSPSDALFEWRAPAWRQLRKLP